MYMRYHILCTALILLLSAFPFNRAEAQTAKFSEPINNFYQTHSIQTLWLNSNGQLQQKALTLIRYLEDAWKHGLNPEIYHLDIINAYIQNPQNTAPRYLDTLISDAFIRYAQDLTSMRVNANDIEQFERYWRKPLPADLLLATALRTTDLEEYLKTLTPTSTLYKRLQEELIQLHNELSQQNYIEAATFSLGDRRYLKPGQHHTDLVPKLRTHFRIPAKDPSQTGMYDEYLANEISIFQRKNYIEPDGIIGPKTLSLLNRTKEDQFYQIIANMHRLRWMDSYRPDKYILVNIPASTLWAVNDGAVELETPVIVGRKKRPTLSFQTEVRGVRFNPTWTVPPTIKRQDYFPLLQEDPLALQKKGIEIRYDGETIDPTTVDWVNLDPRELHALQMVQAPGQDNPLGRIRILMPNKFNIYLHDTSNPEYFLEYDRQFSSGCVRVKDPEKLANFILSENKNWNENYVENKLSTGRMTDILAEKQIPVYLLYLTIWLNDDGSITYGPDIYEWDELFINVLKQENLTIQRNQLKTNLNTRVASSNS